MGSQSTETGLQSQKQKAKKKELRCQGEDHLHLPVPLLHLQEPLLQLQHLPGLSPIMPITTLEAGPTMEAGRCTLQSPQQCLTTLTILRRTHAGRRLLMITMTWASRLEEQP